MSDGKIHIPARKKKPKNESGVVRLTKDAYNALVEIYNDSPWSLTQVGSKIILDAIENNLIVYDKEI